MLFDFRASLRTIMLHVRYLALTWLGLSLAFASAVLIGAFTLHELAYERWINDVDQVAVVETRVMAPGRASERMIASQLVLAPTALVGLDGAAYAARVVERDADLAVGGDWFAQSVLFADPAIVDVFGLVAIGGDARSALTDPNHLVLTRSLANELFENPGAALGRRVMARLDGRVRNFTIAAIIEDPGGPSHTNFSAMARLNHAAVEQPRLFDSWGSLAARTYVRLRAGADVREIERALDAAVLNGLTAQFGDPPPVSMRYALLPITELHLAAPERLADSAARATDRTFVFGLASVGLVIATLAAVNYAALNTAVAARRAREVALRRIVGATPLTIVGNFLAEPIAVSAVSVASGVALAAALLPIVNTQLGLTLSLSPMLSPMGLGGLFAIAVVFGVLAGAGAASLLARSESARVLTGGGAQARRSAGRQRFFVVAAQYAVSITLAALTLVGFVQVQHIRNTALGYDPRNLVLLRDSSHDDWRLFVTLQTTPNVRAVAASSNGPSMGERNEEVLAYNGDATLNIQRIEISRDFFNVYGARLLAGRVIRDDAHADHPRALPEVVINETAARAMGVREVSRVIGRLVRISGVERRVVGVISDIRFGGLREPVRATYYVASANTPILAVRFTDIGEAAALGIVRDVWRAQRPGLPLEARTADEAIISGYAEDDRRNRVLAAFSFVALLLAASGAYALSAYAAERSGREMAIRRVVGADGWTIALLHVWRGLTPALIGAGLAAPIAYVLAARWLSSFDTRIQFVPAYILLAVFAALALAALASISEALALAREPPGARLRSG